MSEAKSFQCPNCGSALAPDGAAKEVKCAFCGSTVIVPEELRDQAPQGQDPQKHLQWLLQSGADGAARIVSVEDLGATDATHQALDLELKVTPASGAPFDTEMPVSVLHADIPQPGAKVNAKYNPDDTFDLAVQINGNWYLT
ncbi:MAG: hypothetical protein WCE68_16230 [Anaerolineales bacterium]